MAVVEPKPTRQEQRAMAVQIALAFVLGGILVGVVGPILVAIVVGKIWGH